MSAPERIYLQDAGDYSKAAALEVTWCVEPQDDGDTGYIRADAVAEMIRQAVQAEREACAKLADDWQNETGTDIAAAARICPQIAAAIRARGDT